MLRKQKQDFLMEVDGLIDATVVIVAGTEIMRSHPARYIFLTKVNVKALGYRFILVSIAYK
jgi:hypothetical protein